MSLMRPSLSVRRTAAAAAAALLLAACGSDGETSSSSGAESGADGGAVESNACPADGCSIGFASIEKSGDELAITWDINFTPDFSRNHIHVYWDVYEPGQVSGDAADNGLEQGEWVPTDVAPTYTTEGAVSTSVRGESTTLCAVASNGDHNILDATTEICQDVSDLL